MDTPGPFEKVATEAYFNVTVPDKLDPDVYKRQSLDQTEAADQQLVLSNILGTLLTLETIRPWEKNPDIYSSGISESAFTIMSRRFASCLLYTSRCV